MCNDGGAATGSRGGIEHGGICIGIAGDMKLQNTTIPTHTRACVEHLAADEVADASSARNVSAPLGPCMRCVGSVHARK